MLLSAVSVLVVAQSSSEIPDGLMNNPVLLLLHLAHVNQPKEFIATLRVQVEIKPKTSQTNKILTTLGLIIKTLYKQQTF